MGGYSCADVENNKSFIETSDRFLRSTKYNNNHNNNNNNNIDIYPGSPLALAVFSGALEIKMKQNYLKNAFTISNEFKNS